MCDDCHAEPIEAVRNFERFEKGNDPHAYGEHDFGKVVVRGKDYFFKFDYFDDDYKYFKPDGDRVLTIMEAGE